MDKIRIITIATRMMTLNLENLTFSLVIILDLLLYVEINASTAHNAIICSHFLNLLY